MLHIYAAVADRERLARNCWHRHLLPFKSALRRFLPGAGIILVFTGKCGVIAFIAALSVIARPALAQNREQQWKYCAAGSVGANAVSADLIIASCTALIQSGQENEQNVARALTNRGYQFAYGKHDPDRGIKDFDQAIKVQPKYARAWAFRCLAYGVKSGSDDAMQDCNAAIKLNPNDATAWAYRGDVFESKGDDDRAIQDYSKAIQLAPKWMWPWNDLAHIFHKRHQWDLAIQGYTRVIQLAPESPMGYNGRCYNRALAGKELTQALSDCNEALRLDPNFSNALNSRGLLQLKLGAFDRAIADYDAALKQNTKDADSLYGRGIARLKSGDAAGGNADVTAAKAIQADIAEVYVGYGVK